ncbi:Chitin synthase, class 1, partial [Quaeritorhiza haematococci]
MVYAFCNLHDVSWGTKGDNLPSSTDSAPVTVEKIEGGKMQATVDLPVHQTDIDAVYELYLREIATPPSESRGDGAAAGGGGSGGGEVGRKGKPKKDPKLKQEDYFKLFRTRVVLLWVVTNLLLIMMMTTPEIADTLGIVVEGPPGAGRGQRQNRYLTAIL